MAIERVVQVRGLKGRTFRDFTMREQDVANMAEECLGIAVEGGRIERVNVNFSGRQEAFDDLLIEIGPMLPPFDS